MVWSFWQSNNVIWIVCINYSLNMYKCTAHCLKVCHVPENHVKNTNCLWCKTTFLDAAWPRPDWLAFQSICSSNKGYRVQPNGILTTIIVLFLLQITARASSPRQLTCVKMGWKKRGRDTPSCARIWGRWQPAKQQHPVKEVAVAQFIFRFAQSVTHVKRLDGTYRGTGSRRRNNEENKT